jgi:hypothetical protein
MPSRHTIKLFKFFRDSRTGETDVPVHGFRRPNVHDIV